MKYLFFLITIAALTTFTSFKEASIQSEYAYALAKFSDNNTLYITDPVRYKKQYYAGQGYLIESEIKKEFLKKLKQYGIEETYLTKSEIKVYFLNSTDKDGAQRGDGELITDRDISLSWRSKHIAKFKESTSNPEVVFVSVNSNMEE